MRRKIDLLEKFGRDGNAASSTDSPQRSVVVDVGVVHVICVPTISIGVAIVVLVGEILLQRITIPVGTSLSVVFCRHVGDFGREMYLLLGIGRKGRDKRGSLQSMKKEEIHKKMHRKHDLGKGVSNSYVAWVNLHTSALADPGHPTKESPYSRC